MPLATTPTRNTSVDQAAEDKPMHVAIADVLDHTGIARRRHAKYGYYQLVVLKRDGRVFQKKFFESRCNGEQATLKLALAWRDTIIAEHAPISMVRFCAIVRSNNTSGVAGVTRQIKKQRRKNGNVYQYPCWDAAIPLGNGKHRYRSFMISKYGEEGAKQRAIEARQQGLADLQNIAYRPNAQHLGGAVATPDEIGGNGMDGACGLSAGTDNNAASRKIRTSF